MQAHDQDELTRRSAIVSLGVVGAALVSSCARTSHANSPSLAPASGTVADPSPPALAGNHQPLPLPYAPGALPGLSERLISSHHDNNYVGAVKNLNRVEQELSRIDTETPPFVVSALRERELTFRNSKTLHEAYFSNLGGDGKRSGGIETALAQAYGSSGRWEEQVKATANGLGGGSGWVILGYELDTGSLRTTASANHAQALATAAPLLVLDMYEHAYQMDFGAAVARYLDAFFANVKWDEVNRRLERAQRASAAWRGTR